MIGIETILNHLKQQGYAYEYMGDKKVLIDGFSTPVDPKPSNIFWIKDKEKIDIESYDDSMGLLIVLEEKYQGNKSFNVISGENSKGIFFSILDRFFNHEKDNITYKPYALITQDTEKGIIIGHNCTIERDVLIGKGTIIKHNVVIQGRVVIGEDCFIDSGAVIGSFGYGYYKSPDGLPMKVPDFGGIIIGNRVNIGANTNIGRGTIGDTIIENDVKIGSLCQIAHNVHVGERSYIISGSVLSGSVEICRDVYIGPSSTIINQSYIEECAHIGIGSVVLNDIDAGRTVFGVPARVIGEREE